MKQNVCKQPSSRSAFPTRPYFGEKKANQQTASARNTISGQSNTNSINEDSVNSMSGPDFDFSGLQAHNTNSKIERRNEKRPDVNIPLMGMQEELVEQPVGGAPAGPEPTPEAEGSCGQPISMHKLTSGPFLGGLTMDSYYPDLTGRGYYDHPGTAGTFDTGSRVGANVQLYGVIPSPCAPDQFHLEQTVTRTRLRRNGVADATEGQTFDDIAKSGRDASRAPFRQDFLGGGTALLGYIISMADPPSIGYDASTNMERDLNFVTSLVGPSGRQSVSWALSTRVAAGVVTSNVVT
jgi:hypothetical protein